MVSTHSTHSTHHVSCSAFRAMRLPNFRMWKLRREGEQDMGHREHATPCQGGAVNYRSKVEGCEALVQAGGSPKLKLGVVHIPHSEISLT